MNCPACRNALNISVELERGLRALECGACAGRWINGPAYQAWLEVNGPNLAEKPSDEALPLPVQDGSRARLCADCGHIMLRFRVGPGSSFFLDRCGVCGGLWLDRNEWEVLRSRNLHDDLHLIGTDHWQSEMRRKESERSFQRRLEARLGEADYGRVQEFKRWLALHPQRSTILAWLADQPQPPEVP